MTDHSQTAATACTCLPAWPALTTVIEGIVHPVVPAPAHTPASALYLARC
ncbi:hypothetical protein JCM4814A_80050 [Streptomyces phaeofaciens JCM 4814]|uniref:Uncharacterized protein n=1 Tax=Streptomyces phaeofaciens TaxID=68254 RepID=A0A918M1C0_9ACTN|nr:hypothetical protein [Streptomyces phaeofaciens]GGT91690.1 hypothetical protein GCM10010226_82130 [Streptomyces phaeofaciens]